MNKESIYQDIKNELIPTIGNGIEITKDHAMDLIGRYINYLITINVIGVIIYIILIAVSLYGIIYFYNKLKKLENENYKYEDVRTINIIIILISITVCVVSFIYLGIKIHDLIQILYIPEIRVYNEFIN